MQLTWLGHASFKLKINEGKLVYIDPDVERYAGFWNLLEKADLILISHWHPGHGSLDTIRQLMKDDTRIVGSSEAASEINGCETMAIGQEKDIGWLKIKAVPAYTPRRPEHNARGNILGFVIEVEGKKIYNASDTELIPEMQALGKVDIAILPVGGTDTMSAAEAVRVVELLNPKVAIPSHWGKKEGTIDDAELFRELVEARTKTKVILINPGETTEL
jgi:L-ascorbate metabolism protein UlaG (beta-lactamase superfamily)